MTYGHKIPLRTIRGKILKKHERVMHLHTDEQIEKRRVIAKKSLTTMCGNGRLSKEEVDTTRTNTFSWYVARPLHHSWAQLRPDHCKSYVRSSSV